MPSTPRLRPAVLVARRRLAEGREKLQQQHERGRPALQVCAELTELLDAIVDRIPPPQGDANAPLQAMVFDSHYDAYRGAVTYVRVMNGAIRRGQRIRFLREGTTHEVLELGQFAPRRRACDTLRAGQVGYLICNIKSIDLVHIGDTVAHLGDEQTIHSTAIKSQSGWSIAGCFPAMARTLKNSAKR